MTEDEAVKMAVSGWWHGKDPVEVVAFQLYEDRLCMDFGDFQLACDKALGRPTWTHEYARPENLRREFEARHPHPYQAMHKAAPREESDDNE